MSNLKILLILILFGSAVNAVEMGMPIQLKLKDPSGNYPNATGVTFTIQVLSPSNGCVLREEDFVNKTVASGTVSLALGSGTRAGYDPNIATLNAVYDNLAAKNNLTCVDSNNAIVASNQTYNPTATDTRIIRVRATINTSNIVVDFIQRAAPYALHAESVGGKPASDILVQNSGTSLNQANLEILLNNATRFNKLQNLAVNGVADTATAATTAGTATNFTANLVGDVTGTQSATVVAAIRGVTVAATAPSSGQVLGYNGSQYVPMTFVASAPVVSVNGQMGAVVLNSSHIAGVITSGTSLLGDVTGNVSATVVSTVGGKAAASIAATVNTVTAATALSTANTLALRDSAGNLVAANVVATGASLQNIYLYEGSNTNRVLVRPPSSFLDYTLVLPTTDGNAGEVLQTDGTGNLSWVVPSGSVTSSSIIAALGYTPANSATVVLKANNLSDLVSATAARTNLGLGGAAVLNVGTSAGTVAAGDDSRIVNALSTSTNHSGDVTGTYNSLTLANSGVASGTYTKVTVNAKGLVTSATSLTSADISTALGFAPVSSTGSTNYLVKANNLSDLVSATAARTNLGLGGAAVLNVGTSAGTVAAGDDSRITGALAQSAFNTYVASANCTTAQTMYWNSVSSTFSCQNIAVSGDISGVASSVTVTKLQNTGVSFSAIANGDILQYNGTNIVNRAIPTCSSGQYLTFNGTAWSCVTDAAAGSGIVSAIAVAAPLQSTGGSTPTLSMTQASGSVSGYVTGTDWTTFNNKLASSTASIVEVLGFTPADSSLVALKANNLSDLTNSATARTNLGLGDFATASTIDLGSASATGTLATARLPAFTGDVSSTAGSNSLAVTQIQGVAVSSTVPVTGQLMVYNGSAWAPTNNPDSYARVTADQAVTNTVLANATNMSFSVVSGVTYKFKFNVLFQSSATTNGLKVSVTAPAGTISANANIPATGTDGTGTVWSGYITSSGDAVTATGTPGTGITYVAFVEGVFVATANGTLQLQFANEAGGNTLTLKAGSHGHLTVIP